MIFYGPSGFGSDSKWDWLRCPQIDLRTCSRDGRYGARDFGEQCPHMSVTASPVAVLSAHPAWAPCSRRRKCQESQGTKVVAQSM